MCKYSFIIVFLSLILCLKELNMLILNWIGICIYLISSNICGIINVFDSYFVRNNVIRTIALSVMESIIEYLFNEIDLKFLHVWVAKASFLFDDTQ